MRVVPRPTHAVDVIVSGEIIHSDGENLVIDVEVHDATGERWFKKRYEGLAAKYAYEPTVPRDIDPFQSVYKAISDDLLAYREKLTVENVSRIRTVAEMKFAREFAPDAFADHVAQTKQRRVCAEPIAGGRRPDAGACAQSARARVPLHRHAR